MKAGTRQSTYNPGRSLQYARLALQSACVDQEFARALVRRILMEEADTRGRTRRIAEWLCDLTRDGGDAMLGR